MILDQGAGAHHAQVEYVGMGWARTWVSGVGAEAAVSATASWQYAIFAGNKGQTAFDENKGHVTINTQP